jgi:hypothetical protein
MRLGLSAALALAGLSLSLPAAAGATCSRPVEPQTPPVLLSATLPTVDTGAFAGHGALAVVSSGTLWVLDGSHPLRQLPVPRGFTASSPVFSHDGKWLAYTTTEVSNTSEATDVWIARADGSDAHLVRAPPAF